MKQEVDNPTFIRFFFFTFCACKTYKLRQKPVLYATRHYQVLKRGCTLGKFTYQGNIVQCQERKLVYTKIIKGAFLIVLVQLK